MSEKYSPTPDIYWAAEPSDKIASAIRERWERYQAQLIEDGRIDVWRRADACYHGRNPDGGFSNSREVTFGGQAGEVAQLHVGHYRRHVGGQLALATSQRPAIEVTATSNDPESVSSTQIARQIIDYDLDEGLEAQAAECHERAIIYSEGYLIQTWDVNAGQPVATQMLAPEIVDGGEGGLPETGEDPTQVGVEMVVRSGEVRVDVRSPLDVARDLDLDTMTDPPWYIVRTRVHRWEVAARFPEDAERRRAILEAPAASADEYNLSGRSSRGGSESDYVHLLTLYHMKTDALPQGRIVEVIGEEWLFDDGYPYDHCVVHRDVPTPQPDAATGYASSWDLLALSQALDAVESGMLSIHDAGSGVNWVAARGQKVDDKMLDGGMKLIEYDDDGMGRPPPGLMERPEVRDSDVKLSEHYQTHMRTISGQNAVVQGDPGANIKAGNFAALVASMAVQAINREASAYAALLRSVCTGRIKLYQSFATTPRIIELSGRDKSGHVEEFTKDKLSGVRRVKVELANPILRTLQGKADVADKMLERYGPMQITIDRYFTLLQTGRLDDIDNDDLTHRVMARKENDYFREGKGAVVQAAISDRHACHIHEHLKAINDIRLRVQLTPEEQMQMQGLLMHVLEHANLWPQMTPAMLAATKQEAVPMAMGMPPGAPPGPDGPPPPGGGSSSDAPMVPGPPPPMQGKGNGAQPGMPGLPTNPLTNVPAPPGGVG